MSPRELIAHYRILSKLGQGGMGAVYRATDTKLNRDVAIKILPDAFAQDATRMQRFEREAQVLATLNHPNIAQIYGIEQGAIVMELVEGADLAGPLPVDVVMDYARQIAIGLEAAHEKGIVHRDLKPANIKVTPDGVIKLLDFGLAKAREESASTTTSPTMSPTLSLAMTQAGMILGTAAYMSPEQAKGRPVDRRADIWAYGVILYELLTGRSLYGAEETVTETLAVVVLKEPDFEALPAGTPSRLRRLIERCLRKDPKQRLRDIGDARLMLEEAEPQPAPAAAVPVAAVHKAGARLWIALAVALIALIAVSAIHFRESTPPREVVRFTIPPPEGGFAALNSMALSPDGKTIAYSSNSRVWIRRFDSLEAHPLAGTDHGDFLFWSPDGKYLGFAADGKLKKIDLAGSPAQTLCSTVPDVAPQLAAWSNDGMIYFNYGREGIFRVPQAGGEPVRITRTDTAAGEEFHAYPYPLPDGRHLLFHVVGAVADKSGLYMVSLDGKDKKRITPTLRSSAYVPPQEGESQGHLLVIRQDVLTALPVNPRTMDPAGEPFPVAEHIGNLLSTAFFTASQNGALAYRTGGLAGLRRLVWLDRTGKELGTAGTPGKYNTVVFSPDGARAAVTLDDSSSANPDIWLIDLARGVPSRFTFHEGLDTDPVWSPDGNKIVFASQREGRLNLYWKDSNGAAQEEPLVKPENTTDRPSDWSADGRHILFRRGVGTVGTLWTVDDPLDPAKRKVSPYLDNEHANSQGQFSPGKDGPRWVAYSSNESKQGREVFVQSFPAGAGKYQISTGGGMEPRWRRDGKELFYIAPDGKLMAVDVRLSPRFEAGIPHSLFDTRIFIPQLNIVFRYDVTPDGKRFLVDAVNQDQNQTAPITVVLNWLAAKK